jgi:UDP-N-acetylglucosamine:LPS N-acetylglucosamine transferase
MNGLEATDSMGRLKAIDEVKRSTVMAVASGGGHWTQLLRLRPALAHCDVVYVSTIRSHADEVPEARYVQVPDANRWQRWRALRCALKIGWLLLRIRPDVVVSTGALPGYLAVVIAKRLGRRTIWIDSIANAEELSMSGQLAGRHCDVWLTQWPHLATPDGPTYAGSVLG